VQRYQLKSMEREQVLRVEPGGLVVLDRAALLRIGADEN
jgi:CRP/FNR family transcriptional regulator, cyclic AMP receptor protein